MPQGHLVPSNCSEETADFYKAKAKATEFARPDFRFLSVTIKVGDSERQLFVMLPMFDSPREDIAPTIAEAQVLGLSSRC